MTFPHTATIEALTLEGTKSSYTSAGSTPCFLQPLDIEAANQYSIVMSKAFACYLPFDLSIEEGHRLTIDGTKYSVKGVKAYNYGTLKHRKAILEMKV